MGLESLLRAVRGKGTLLDAPVIGLSFVADRKKNAVSYYLGSGSLVSPDGYFVTNAHVPDGRSSGRAFVGGESYDCRVLYIDQHHDLALGRVVGAPRLLSFDVFAARDPLAEYAMGNIRVRSYAVVRGQKKSSYGIMRGDCYVRGGDAYLGFSTCSVARGWSGGPVVDRDGLLVGLTKGGLSGKASHAFVRLSDVQRFVSVVAKNLSVG